MSGVPADESLSWSFHPGRLTPAKALTSPWTAPGITACFLLFFASSYTATGKSRWRPSAPFMDVLASKTSSGGEWR